MRRAAAAAAAITLIWAPAVSAAHGATSQDLLRRGIAHALAQHWMKPDDAARYRRDVNRALWDERRLPKLRARVIESQLLQLTNLWDSLTSPRALALFTQLEQNLDYFETHRIPDTAVDVSDGEGVVYRWFPYKGLEFHPLASFSALANAASAHDVEKTQSLAYALVDRAIPRGPRLIWEYSFGFGIGRPPWASGMAEALAAQALARAGSLLGDPLLTAAAARAYAAVPHLVTETAAGPWIQLYGFDREIVLNAQLQTIVSLTEYGQTTGNGAATALAQRMAAAAKALFPRFDTGDWSLYELRGAHASLGYEQYVTTLLGKLAFQTKDPYWSDAAQRFQAYLGAPRVSEGAATPTVYPQPADGWLDTATIPITLSQRSSVTLTIAGKVFTYRFARGTHVITWTPPPALAPGTYPITVSAISYVGLRSTMPLAPIVVAFDTAPPAGLQGQLAGTTLTWQADDPGTPWLHLVVQLVDPAGVNPPQTLDLGQQPVSGTTQVAVPAGTWQATLSATNSAGQTATLDLGTVQGTG
ncbi:MAG TPA: D-glucuronyl C5-epimerase family protein [Gaiellaceae bacterium]|nr:D-glucuronyl C5-epimerase family protein [Gaiellaceae bacterium]